MFGPDFHLETGGWFPGDTTCCAHPLGVVLLLYSPIPPPEHLMFAPELPGGEDVRFERPRCRVPMESPLALSKAARAAVERFGRDTRCSHRPGALQFTSFWY